MRVAETPEAFIVAGVVAVYGLIIVLVIAGFILWLVALVDCVRREFPDPNEKVVWVLVIILTHLLGALIYFCVGRRKGRLPGPQRPSA